MLPVSQELKEKLKKVNLSLREIFPRKYFEKKELRNQLSEIGSFYQIKKLDPEVLEDWLAAKSIVGVDGSVNSTKGSPLRVLSVFQALAKSTKGEEKWAADVYTPLLDQEARAAKEGIAAREARKRGELLSALELEVAKVAIQEWKPKVVLMDGSLLHFYIDDAKRWEQVVELAEKYRVYIVGIAEEMGTSRLVQEHFPELTAWSDRELLHHALDVGEAFEWKDWSPSGSGLWKMAFRSSKNPIPIGVDGLLSQWSERFRLLELIFALTPEQGRGIPFWLDVVDSQVRVTDRLVESMVEQYLDPDLRQRLIMPKRSERII